MSVLGTIAGIATIGSAVVGAKTALDSADAAQQAAEAQSQAAAIARRQEALRAARQRRELIRSRRIAAAENLARGVSRGVVGSSALTGIQSALNTNFASNLSFLDQMAALSTQRGSFLDQAQQSAATSDIFGALSSLAFTGAGVGANIFSRTEEGRKFDKFVSGL